MEKIGGGAMNSKLKAAMDHWCYVSPILTQPKTETEYNRLVKYLDEVLEAGGANEHHPLASLADHLGNLIAAYEDSIGIEISEPSGREMVGYLMEMHGIKQSDLPEIGSQGVVSEILNGKRELNVRQIRLLSERFKVNPAVFV
jgi:HTH-type transcriptional regulator/antitoxin HigA